MLSEIRFLILFCSEVYGLNKQIYFYVAIGWDFMHGHLLVYNTLMSSVALVHR